MKLVEDHKYLGPKFSGDGKWIHHSERTLNNCEEYFSCYKMYTFFVFISH